jgi:hypothetical protein
MGASALAGGALRGLAIAAGMVTIFGAAPARAQTSWIDATGSWFNAANWSAGVPPQAGGTIVGNGGTARIDAGALADAGVRLDILNGGSTVNLQAPGSSLQAGMFINVGPNGTLLLSGSTAVNTPFLELAGGTLRATFTGPQLTNNNLVFVDGTTSTVAASAGQTLALFPTNFVLGPGATPIFGSATDTGTVVLGGRPGWGG